MARKRIREQNTDAQLCYHTTQINTLIGVQNVRIPSVIEEARKRHCRVLLSAMKEKLGKQLMEKDMELKSARQRNAELDQKTREITAMRQFWYNIANNNEAIISSLNVTIQAVATPPLPVAIEGFGDSEELPFGDNHNKSGYLKDHGKGVGEVQAAAFRREDDQEMKHFCRVCRESEACVLLLPCRHLCLCRHCESKLELCPICNSFRKASIQIIRD